MHSISGHIYTPIHIQSSNFIFIPDLSPDLVFLPQIKVKNVLAIVDVQDFLYRLERQFSEAKSNLDCSYFRSSSSPIPENACLFAFADTPSKSECFLSPWSCSSHVW